MHQYAVRLLTGVEIRQPEVQHGEHQVDIQIIDDFVFAVTGTVGFPGGNQFFAAGSRHVAARGEVVVDVQLREHSQRFGGFEFFLNFRFQFGDAYRQIVFECFYDTFFKRQFIPGLKFPVLGFLKMQSGVFRAFFRIICLCFASRRQKQQQNSGEYRTG